MKINNPVGDNIRKNRARMGTDPGRARPQEWPFAGLYQSIGKRQKKIYPKDSGTDRRSALYARVGSAYHEADGREIHNENRADGQGKRKRFMKDLRNLLRDMPINTLEHYIKLFKLEKELERRETGNTGTVSS